MAGGRGFSAVYREGNAGGGGYGEVFSGVKPGKRYPLAMGDAKGSFFAIKIIFIFDTRRQGVL